MGLAIDSDLVGHGPEVVIATVCEHHALIEPEQVAVLGDLTRARSFLYNDVEIVDTVDDPLW